MYRYKSIYDNHIEQFISMKRKLGFKYQAGAVKLQLFDRFVAKQTETAIGITKELAEKWCKKEPNESQANHYDRVRLLVEFSLYLCDLNISSYIPKLPPYPKNSFTPYIYSRQEMDAIFDAADNLRQEARIMNSCIFSVPALIRLLYGTGIRIGEALGLKESDINLHEKYLCVKDSKNGQQRLIPISDTLVSVCKEYLTRKNQIPLGKSKTDYLFITLDGKRCNRYSFSHWFKKCLLKANIRCERRNSLPRIHDLRHTFAVTSLANMADADIDLYASLPILSTYLGHRSIGATNHYVRLTANMYPGLIKDADAICLNVFPKLNNYEAD